MATKSESVTVPVAAKELLPIKGTWISVDSVGHRTKSIIVDLPDEYGPQDLNDNPRLWRTTQQDTRTSLSQLDRVTLVWHDKIATAIVDHTEPDAVYLTKMSIVQRNPRDREPFNDGKYAVRAFQGKYAAFRIADNVRMGNLHDRWEGARSEIWNLTGVKVA